MAKKSGRKTKGSAKADTPSSANPEKKPATALVLEKPDEKKPAAKKKSDIACQFCNKPMKDEKTRKVHERNCRAKQSASPSPQKDRFETAIMELKDHFNDEVMSMSKTLQEREEHHQRELDEVKTVLRMEIDRHRKELDRIGKAEKEATAEAQAPATGQPAIAEQPSAQSPHTPEAQPLHAEPQPDASPEPARDRDSRPRAIDLIPMHLPAIPKRKYAPLPEEDSIPEIDGDEFSPRGRSVPEINRGEIEALIRDIVRESLPEAPSSQGSDRIQAKIDMMYGRIDAIESKLDKSIADIRKSIDKSSKDAEYKRIEKEMEKVSEKVIDIMEDSGYGESLSVAKIPPTILEIVYQAILDDIHIEIVKTKGPQDAERVARSALEEVRLKTSGSELFKFDGRKIVTDSLAKSIESNMISARQIQTTYDVLLDKLLETVPHHKAKNFKGMIKVKSQEFAVDRATKLTKDFGKFEKVVESTNQMVAAMAANFSTRNLELHEMLNEMKDNTLATKADRDEIEALKSKVQDIIDRDIKLTDELALLKAELEMKDRIRSSAEGTAQSDSGLLLAPGEMPFPDFSEPRGDSPASAEDAQPTPEIQIDDTKHDEMIMDAIRKGLDSKTALMKDTGLDETIVIETLARLVGQMRLIEKRIGKRLKYTTLEKELETKLEAEGARQAETPPPRKGRKPSNKPLGQEPVESVPASIVAEEPQPAVEPEKKPAPDYDFKRLEPPKSKKGKKTQEAKPPEADRPEETAEEMTVSKEPQRKKKVKAPKKTKGKADAQQKKEKPLKKAAELPKPEEPEKTEDIKTAPETEKEHPSSKVEMQPEAEKPAESKPEPEESILMDDFPVIKKALGELSEDEVNVLEAISEEGMTVSGIQSKVGKQIKRFALLRALRVLIDSGYVGILTKGRLELYQKINVQKMDKMKQEEKQKEVK